MTLSLFIVRVIGIATVLAVMANGLKTPEILLRLLSVLVLIAINAFFVTAEFSMVSVRRSRINQLVEAGDTPAKTVQDLQRNIDRLLSTTQIGITLSSLALGWIGENTLAVLVTVSVQQWPLPANIVNLLAHTIAVPVAFMAIAYLQIVLGELCPKSVALLYPEELARLLGPLSLVIARLFNPFIWVLNQSTRWLLRLGGIQYTGQGWWYNQLTSEELQLIIATSSESSGLEADERELLTNVFEFREVTAGEVMVPRTNIDAVTDNAAFQALVNQVAASGHSRFPVIGESLDDIRGIIYFKDLAKPLAEGQLSPQTPIKPWIQAARFVPEGTLLSELLPFMQKRNLSMVMVVDEFGGTAGLVTLKDLTAEIIGETHEPMGTEEPAIRVLDPQTFLIQAQTDLEEVNERLSLNLPLVDEYQTLGGFVLYYLQRIPTQGEIFRYETLEFTISVAEGPRLKLIQVHRLGTKDPLTDPSLTSSPSPHGLTNGTPLTDAQPTSDQTLQHRP
jgi:CBS domain containing-hemolysin-like protein